MRLKLNCTFEEKVDVLQKLFKEYLHSCAVHYSFAVQEKAREFILYSAAAINRINGLAVEIPYCFLSYC